MKKLLLAAGLFLLSACNAPTAGTVTAPLTQAGQPLVVSFTPLNKITASGTFVTNVEVSDVAAVKEMSLKLDDEIIGVDVDSPFTFQRDILPINNGLHTLTLRVTDRRGNTGTYSQSLEVAIAKPDVPAMNELEQKTFELVNELRTRGTLEGNSSIRAGTCMADWKPLPALQDSVALRYAARKHAQYQIQERWLNRIEIYGHEETLSSSALFYGASILDRSLRAFTDLGLTAPNYFAENVGGADHELSPQTVVKAWLTSSTHCPQINSAKYVYAGIGTDTRMDSTRKPPVTYRVYVQDFSTAN